MQTKRLTLDEYRKVNAIWLSNNRSNFAKWEDNEYYVAMYSHYLLAYGINIELFELIRSELNLTSAMIEKIINEHEAITEHCPH